jgi:hypothetical protein
VRADATGGKRTIALDGAQFIARLLQHVLPAGFKRIRHCGLRAAGCWHRRPRRSAWPECIALARIAPAPCRGPP